ncbi:MAG: DUF4339 domain-containing protein, partial [Bacteroidales bacterium]|nr:DUF4339 domain-containing protein [Bacteroidales bacterium]
MEDTRNRLYYYAENGEKFGPYTYQELLDLPIREDTLVWHKGLAEWVCANELGELACMFQTTPPPLPESAGYTRAKKKQQLIVSQDVIKRRRFMAVVLISFALVVTVALFFIIYILKNDMPNPPMPDSNASAADSSLVESPIMLNTSTAKPVVTLHAATKVNSTSAVVSARIIQGTSSISSETVEYAVQGTKKFWSQVLVREKGRGVGYIGNLKPETTYKYRVRVKSKAGTVLTDWNTFTTLPKAV